MNRNSIPTTAELYEMFLRCALEFNTIYAFRIPKVNRLIAVVKLRSRNGVPGCGYNITRVINIIKDSLWEKQVRVKGESFKV